MKPKTFRSLSLIASLLLASGCVSASKHKDLENEHTRTQESLAACEVQKAELEKKLGVTSTQKSELEGSVANMKRALSELEARRQETEKRLAEFRELTAKFKPLVDTGKLTIRVRNGRMMIALSTDVLFSSGSAKLSADGATAVSEVAGVLKDLQNRNFQIEGHTDNVPIKTKAFPSNWELASARASSVMTTLLGAGMAPEHVSIASYGSYDPIADNGTPEGRRENRRIAIVIVPDLSGLPGFEELNRLSPEAKPST
jgi:chemotaxis protein MotB